jgi:uncharacterized protein (UPF0548 family)
MEEATLRRLGQMHLSYQAVGQTAADPPPGYHVDAASRFLGTGLVVFQQARERLMTWRMHELAGLQVTASTTTATPDTLVLLRMRKGPFSVTAPCRVVYVVDEPNRQGFAYGTLPGHPETGEESFVVQIAEDESVTAHIKSFSRPASWLARLGGPVARGVQARTTQSYLRALTPSPDEVS